MKGKMGLGESQSSGSRSFGSDTRVSSEVRPIPIPIPASTTRNRINIDTGV